MAFLRHTVLVSFELLGGELECKIKKVRNFSTKDIMISAMKLYLYRAVMPDGFGRPTGTEGQ